jgi:hypothetical protein
MPIRRIVYNGSAGNDVHLLWGDVSRNLTLAICFPVTSMRAAIVWAKRTRHRRGCPAHTRAYRPFATSGTSWGAPKPSERYI